MLSTSSVCLYPNSIKSFAVFINALKIDFSSTILTYFSTLAVVGTLSGKLAIYSSPPTAANFSIDVNSSFTVIISIGTPLE